MSSTPDQQEESSTNDDSSHWKVIEEFSSEDEYIFDSDEDEKQTPSEYYSLDGDDKAKESAPSREQSVIVWVDDSVQEGPTDDVFHNLPIEYVEETPSEGHVLPISISDCWIETSRVCDVFSFMYHKSIVVDEFERLCLNNVLLDLCRVAERGFEENDEETDAARLMGYMEVKDRGNPDSLQCILFCIAVLWPSFSNKDKVVELLNRCIRRDPERYPWRASCVRYSLQSVKLSLMLNIPCGGKLHVRMDDGRILGSNSSKGEIWESYNDIASRFLEMGVMSDDRDELVVDALTDAFEHKPENLFLDLCSDAQEQNSILFSIVSEIWPKHLLRLLEKTKMGRTQGIFYSCGPSGPGRWYTGTIQVAPLDMNRWTWWHERFQEFPKPKPGSDLAKFLDALKAYVEEEKPLGCRKRSLETVLDEDGHGEQDSRAKRLRPLAQAYKEAQLDEEAQQEEDIVKEETARGEESVEEDDKFQQIPVYMSPSPSLMITSGVQELNINDPYYCSAVYSDELHPDSTDCDSSIRNRRSWGV